AMGAAALLFALAPRAGWTRLAASAAAIAVAAIGTRELSPAPFRPAGLFWNIVFAEGHTPHAVRETVDGAALLVEEPVREERNKTTRIRRVRVDRVDRTPDLDDRGGYELAIATAAAIHGAPERVLLLAPPLPRTIELLRRAGAKFIDAAPLPATAASVAAPFGAVEIGDAGPDGLRPAAGQRGYDLVVMPPTPSFPADASSSLRTRHLRALEGALAPGGVLGMFLDAATTPIDVAASLAADATSGRPNAGAIFVADGVLGASIGILSRAGDGPLVTTRSAFAPGPLAEFVPSLSPDLATIRGQIFSPTHRSFSSSVSARLPPISTARSFARVALDPRANRASIARLAERWLAEAGASASLLSARHLAAAVAEMESAEWIHNMKRVPAETIPIPTPATDAVAAAIAALPGPGPGRAAYRQLAHLLDAQREVSRLYKFAGTVHASDPGNWRASRDVARTMRELLDPEGSLQMLDETAMPDEEDGLVGFSVERARTLLALKRGDDAITSLRLAMQAHPTSVALALELAETFKALGNMADATLWAKHAETLHRAAEARGH
ncbi:MAG TPA: hypothetical protein VKE69_10630, partial [Planctomycetota bacterium]|nr:hypothetical protein [Planctomycetota bacterium]